MNPKAKFNAGDRVRIKRGPLMNFSGVIEEVLGERRKLRIDVIVFGRKTLMDLEYSQVEKA